MKVLRICILFFSFCGTLFFSQSTQPLELDTLTTKKKSDVIIKKIFKSDKKYHKLFIGVDVLHLGLIPFSEAKNFTGFLNFSLNKTIYLAADLGVESNTYTKNEYDAKANGIFAKLGAYYMLMQEDKTPTNGFYVGAKLGMSLYSQTYNRIPVKGYKANDSSTSLPTSNQNSNWIELPIGARVQVFDTHFYLDIQAQPRFMLYQTKQDNLQPMKVPGFGKSASNSTLGFMWALAYRF